MSTLHDLKALAEKVVEGEYGQFWEDPGDYPSAMGQRAMRPRFVQDNAPNELAVAVLAYIEDAETVAKLRELERIEIGIAASETTLAREAAEPDLYAASELALYAIDNILPSLEGQYEHAEMKAVFDALEAALNKADGKEAAEIAATEKALTHGA